VICSIHLVVICSIHLDITYAATFGLTNQVHYNAIPISFNIFILVYFEMSQPLQAIMPSSLIFKFIKLHTSSFLM